MMNNIHICMTMISFDSIAYSGIVNDILNAIMRGVHGFYVYPTLDEMEVPL